MVEHSVFECKSMRSKPFAGKQFGMKSTPTNQPTKFTKKCLPPKTGDGRRLRARNLIWLEATLTTVNAAHLPTKLNSHVHSKVTTRDEKEPEHKKAKLCTTTMDKVQPTMGQTDGSSSSDEEPPNKRARRILRRAPSTMKIERITFKGRQQ